MPFSSYSSAMTGKELYYWRIDAFLKTVGELNQVRGVYDKLDEDFMPPEVRFVFDKYFRNNPRIVREKYNELTARIERQWGAIIESLKELGLSYNLEDAQEFRSMARSTTVETDFREKVRKKVERLYNNAVAIRNGTASKRIKDLPAQSLRDLITWYRSR